MTERIQEAKANISPEKLLVLPSQLRRGRESCQHSCTWKIKRQEALPEHIYNTSNISKSIKAPLIHWTLTLPLGCCQIHQLGISSRKAAAGQALVTSSTKQEFLAAPALPGALDRQLSALRPPKSLAERGF